VKRLILSLLILCSGCAHYTCKFPAEIDAVAHGCKNEAQAKIQAKGSSLKMKSDCSVTEIPSDKNYNGMWCWYDPTWKMYVGGLCGGSWIQIGCNPNNRADIHSPSLTHEMGHYWLMTNFGDYTHNPKYDNDFNNWRGSREVIGSSFDVNKAEYGKLYSLTYTNKFGELVHADLIKLDK
jgi:hypothetical protein